MTANTPSPNTIALLGFGEAGSTIARGLAKTWRTTRHGGRRLLAVDIALGEGPRGEAMAALARELDIGISRDYTDTLAQAELVISVVTGDEALNAARSACAWLAPGTFYLDFNSITGGQTREVAEVFEGSGVRFVDVGVMGGFAALGLRAPMLLSAPDAEMIAAWMNSAGFDARALGPRIGDASAVKILRSIISKGVEALAVECLVGAHRQGIVREILESFGDVDSLGFAGYLETLTVTHLVHAKRRMEEVERSATSLRESGIEPIMASAIIRNHKRTCEANVRPEDGAKPQLEEALKILSERVIG